MIKLFRPLIPTFLFIAIAAASCAPAATPAPPTQTLAPRIPTLVAATAAPAPTQGAFVAPSSCAANDFDSQCAYAQNQMLAVTIGVRVAGSPSGTRAGDYIADQFKSFGYAVDKQEFTFEPWEDLGTKVQLTSPESRDLQAVPMQFESLGSISWHFEAEVAAVNGMGNPEDFANANVSGKIALVQRGTLQFLDKAKNAATAGAIAIMIYNNEPSQFRGSTQNFNLIPAFSLSGGEGQQILDALKRGTVKVKINRDTRVTKEIGHNIIATKPGTNGKTLILGGHYDTVPAGPGADDNGSGTAVVIELARVLAKRESKYTLVFIAFDAEEEGLFGSRYYANQLNDAERKNVTAMLNFDMLAGGKGPLGLGGDGTIAQLARSDAKILSIAAENAQLPNNAGSDHQSFARIGIDTLYFSRNDYALLHTPQDSIDQVHADWLGEAGRIALQALMDLNSN